MGRSKYFKDMRGREKATWRENLELKRKFCGILDCISDTREIAGEKFLPTWNLVVSRDEILPLEFHRRCPHVYIFHAINKVDPFNGGDSTEGGGGCKGSKCIVYSNAVSAQFIQRGRSSNIPISRFAWRLTPSTRRVVFRVRSRKKQVLD